MKRRVVVVATADAAAATRSPRPHRADLPTASVVAAGAAAAVGAVVLAAVRQALRFSGERMWCASAGEREREQTVTLVVVVQWSETSQQQEIMVKERLKLEQQTTTDSSQRGR